MRTIVTLKDSDAEELDTTCKRLGISRAEGIRRAILIFTTNHRDSLEKHFGAWKKKKPSIDGLLYQKRLRSEWKDEK